jgi:lauroyl/myristoyl acyltransferase
LGQTFFRVLDSISLALFNLTRFLSHIFPASFLYAIFNFIGSVLFYIRPGMRHRLLKIVRSALPDIENSREVSRLARKACGAALHPMLDIVILKRHGETILDRLQVEGIENLEKADSQGKGVIIITSHLGAFSIGTSVLARVGKPITPIGFRPKSTMVPRYVEALMLYVKPLGCDPENPIIYVRRDIIQRVLEHLEKGKRVGIAYDVMGDHIVKFFGRPTALVSGIAHFACQTGCPIVPVCILHGKGALDFRLIIESPLIYELSNDREKDVETVMGEIAKAGEDMIMKAPEQWMGWFGLTIWQDKAERINGKKHAKDEKIRLV